MTTTKKAATKVSEKTVQEITKVWNTANPTKIAELFTEDGTFQDPGTPTAIKGKTAIKTYLEQQYASFPDSQIALQTAIVQGNKGAATGTWTGTNKGPLPTPDGKSIPATNKKVSGEWAAFVTFNADGKVKAFKLYADNLAVFQQLGLAPQQ
jgi:steroid delta-isomerase-like uncharacterized protein